MLDEIGANCGALPERLTGDNGFYTDANVRYCETCGVDPYLSVGRRMLLRGTTAVRAEWALICTGHNLLKLFGAVRQRLTSSAVALYPA